MFKVEPEVIGIIKAALIAAKNDTERGKKVSRESLKKINLALEILDNNYPIEGIKAAEKWLR
jgi:AMMECR1 domain-containing protein